MWQCITCDWRSNTVAGGHLGAVHIDDCHLKVAGPAIGQGQGEVHERVKLDGVVLAVLLGADEGGFVQALQP